MWQIKPQIYYRFLSCLHILFPAAGFAHILNFFFFIADIKFTFTIFSHKLSVMARIRSPTFPSLPNRC